MIACALFYYDECFTLYASPLVISTSSGRPKGGARRTMGLLALDIIVMDVIWKSIGMLLSHIGNLVVGYVPSKMNVL